ncbi:MAG: InlB B-repeat-containing protein [Clostridia bacterium]|nr:InlB B-repeat-containing protein [Clostridia bacterium]
MKRLISVLLSAALLLSAFSVPAFAAPEKKGDAPAAVWNAKKQTFTLKKGPEIVRISSDSDNEGTSAKAYYRATDEVKTLAAYWYQYDRNDQRTFAAALGTDPENVEAALDVGVQFAYSFDGKTWVDDFGTGDGYYPEASYDLDEDGFDEYREMPTENIDILSLYRSIWLFNGDAGFMRPYYCDVKDGLSVEQTLALYNKTILQGRGEFTGSSYDPENEDENGKGFRVDFNKETLYVKARYRVYTRLEVCRNGEWQEARELVSYSDWSEVKTYNNATASADAQDCVPDDIALNTTDAPTLTLLASERYDTERDGVEMKATRARFMVSYPEKTEDALAKYYALEPDVRQELTGEYYDPDYVIEIRVGSGEWYVVDDPNANDVFFWFDDDFYGTRDLLEAIGYQPEDPVYLRVSLYGSYSRRVETAEGAPAEQLHDADEVFIRTARSNEVELSLTGKFKVEYALDGGSFAYDTEQVTMFDENSDITVDLTAADYIPTRAHYTFDGWYADAALSEKIESFDTSLKASRTYYAKWKELPSYGVTYDLGTVTDYVYNGNPDKIWSDDKDVEIADVSYAGAEFLGWYDAPQNGKKIEKLNYAENAGDITLYAYWRIPEKKIAYDGAGKDYTNNKKNPASYPINPEGDNTVVIYAPEKTGYIFDGWFLDKDLEHAALTFDNAKGGWLLNESEDVTLYAKWIVGRWKITYKLGLDGVSNSANPEEYTYGKAVSLEALKENGYTFDGWFADADFKTAATGVSATDTGDKTFYAKWTVIKYKNDYRLRDGDADHFKANENPATRTVEDEIVLKPLVPAEEGWEFLGWYDNVNFSGKPVEKIIKGTVGDVTLFAKCEKIVKNERKLGDVNNDGRVNSTDARLTLRTAARIETLADGDIPYADVDFNGKINSSDARKILRAAAKLEALPEKAPANG